MSLTPDTLRLWTGQRQIVVDTLKRDGYCYVKWDYISRKYEESAWIFQIAYAFLAQLAEDRGIRPQGADSAFWLYHDPQWICQGEDCSLLRLDVPAERIITFDLRLWQRILNLEYIGENREDEISFQQELAQLGLKNTLPVFKTAFYPLQKRKVQQSWNRLLSLDDCPDKYLQAAVWELRLEWLQQER